ncbi:Rrf2 family transcriptional regulator [Vibrio parahaemolyticus]|uniref:Rrf2 family transcriptional regulator n=1 Tax=Vibrio parahaemolyticus TaxID=670 RepID=UPI00155936E5|nr:Rrf2 family transcriptional regulator [Vibrio parahaemolyticus]
MKNKTTTELLNKPLNTGIYLVRIMLEQRGNITAQSLSEAAGISISNTEQLLRILRNSKIIESRRGPNGGYTVANKNVTVRDIALAFNPGMFDSDVNKELHACLKETMGKMKLSEWENENEL